MANDNNKDIANSLNKYTDYTHKGTNLMLDGVNNINKWYANQLDKLIENDIDAKRIETNVDNNIIDEDKLIESKIQTKVDEYNEIQTNNIKAKLNISNSKIKTKSDENIEIELDNTDKNVRLSKVSKRISTTIKGIKLINNSTQRMIKTGKNISSGMNNDSAKSFENSASRIMTKPVRKIEKKVVNKATNKIVNAGKKVASKTTKKVITKTNDVLIKTIKLITKLIADTLKILISMLPQIAPVIIIIVIIATFCSYFGIGMSDDVKKQYEKYMIDVQEEYNKITVDFYNNGKVVDGTIEGKGMINWKAPLSILQMLNGDLSFDGTEKEILEKFKKADLYEKIEDVTYSYEKDTGNKDKDGNKIMETVTDTKKVVSNATLDSYIDWCNKNFKEINLYKKKKKIDYDESQTKFTDDEIQQIKLLYNSNSFFELFSSEFKNTYAYLCVDIGDEQLQLIYNEFLINAGKRYLMDHSNLKYDECMEYYDCSSWVIHCLAHTGIKTIANTGAKGIYDNHCYPVSVNDRKAGDLIFLKDTYDTGSPGSISHIGIYMGELNINGEIAEWVIDTGGNPSGVRIRKYNNGWWNGQNFYGFGRLK